MNIGPPIKAGNKKTHLNHGIRVQKSSVVSTAHFPARSALQGKRQHKCRNPASICAKRFLSASPVQFASARHLCYESVLPRLASVASPAQPSEIAERERSQLRFRAQCLGNRYRQPVVHLIRFAAAYLAQCQLHLLRLLPRCHSIGVQTIGVPARFQACCALIAPTADTVNRRLSPASGAVDKSSGVRRPVSRSMQQQTAVLPACRVMMFCTAQLPCSFCRAVLSGPVLIS